jgi:hypothetical protein
MTKSEELFHRIAAGIPGTEEGKMFGALCVKAPNGKAGVMYWKGFMIFKLDKDHEKEALALKDAKIFEPAEGRPMNGWVQLSDQHSAKWKRYAELAMDNVKNIEVPAKKPKTPKKATGK